jgi:hypothetical protein
MQHLLEGGAAVLCPFVLSGSAAEGFAAAGWEAQTTARAALAHPAVTPATYARTRGAQHRCYFGEFRAAVDLKVPGLLIAFSVEHIKRSHPVADAAAGRKLRWWSRGDLNP